MVVNFFSIVVKDLRWMLRSLLHGHLLKVTR